MANRIYGKEVRWPAHKRAEGRALHISNTTLDTAVEGVGAQLTKGSL